jgi:hypothetical protein
MPASTCLLVEPIGARISYYSDAILQTGCFELMVAHSDEEARKYVSEHSWLSSLIVDTAVPGYAELARFVRRRSPRAVIVIVGEADQKSVPEANAVIGRQSPDQLIAALRGHSGVH